MGHEQKRRLGLVGPGGIPIIGSRDPNDPMSYPPVVRDAFGRILAEGDIVTLHSVRPQPYKVQTIREVRESGTPPGLMEIEVVHVARFRAVRNQGNLEFARVMTGAEAGTVAQGEAESNGNGPIEEMPPASDDGGEPVQ